MRLEVQVAYHAQQILDQTQAFLFGYFMLFIGLRLCLRSSLQAPVLSDGPLWHSATKLTCQTYQ